MELRGSIDAGALLGSPWVFLNSIENLWMITATVLVLFMQAGFLLLEGGSVRSKNSINVAQKNITDLILCGGIFFLFGASVMFGTGATGWFGFGGFSLNDSNLRIEFVFQLAFCATAATIISGAVSERKTFRGYIILTILMAGLIYPGFGHLVWGDTLVSGNAAFLKDIGFLDFAGSTVVHVIGGAAALAAVLKIGPRIGRFDEYGNTQKIRGHSSLMANLGVMILIIGWIGFNAGASTPGSDQFSLIILNTIIALVFGGIAGIAVDVSNRSRVFHPRSARNGILGGLVAITAGCAFVDTTGATVIGFAGGLAAVLSSDFLTEKFKIDDPVDVVAVHCIAGIAGTVLLAGFALPEFLAGSRLLQFGIQSLGVFMAVVWAFGVTWLGLSLLSGFVDIRVTAEEEEIGLNICEHDDDFDSEILIDLIKKGADQQAVNIASGLGEKPGQHGLGAELIDDGAVSSNENLNVMAKIVDGAKVDRRRIAEANTQIDHLSTKDQLTGLYNRAYFIDMTTNQLRFSEQNTYAILYCDLDGFKSINDSFGHGIGDKVLQVVSAKIAQSFEKDAIVARFGGDEFVIFLPLDSGESDTWEKICKTLIQNVGQKIVINNLELYVGLSVGVALNPEHSRDISDLIRLADMALYEAKAEGKGRFVCFESSMQERAERRKQLEIDMRAGVMRDEFHTVYQPQYCIRDSQLLGFEALMRWDHPSYGSISPVEFIPIAEETGLIVELSERLIRTACEAAAGWPPVNGKRCTIAVNISPIQFFRLDVRALISDVLDSTGLLPDLLEIEITESTLVQDMQKTARVLEEIRALGVKIAIDDFGTGYSSLNYLQRFPIDRLKVDRSFISELAGNANDRQIVNTIVQLGKSLGLSVIAEGVETQTQRDTLKELDCDQVQGFLFSPPVSPSRALSIICDANLAKDETTNSTKVG